MPPPAVSVVVPTRNRSAYLAVALDSLNAQERDEPYEVVVVDDASTDATPEVATARGVRVVPAGPPGGLNAARNTGIDSTSAPLVAFVDDDVWAPPGWLAAVTEGARRHPSAEAFGGPIRARLEGPAPGACGREPPPITTLDLGPVDTAAAMVWGANFAVRREAFERLGRFDPTLGGHGDEEDWLLALLASGGEIVYLAAAALDHRRAGADARLRALMRAAFHRGRSARRSDARRGTAPGAARELRDVAGAGWHTLRRRCPQGLIMGAHSGGRLAETLRKVTATGEQPGASAATAGAGGATPGASAAAPFLSGESGEVSGIRRRVRATAADLLMDVAAALALTGARLDRLAAATERQRVLVTSVYRPGSLLAAALPRLRSQRHDVRFALGATGREPDRALECETLLSGLSGGKFENLNELLAAVPGTDHDWLLVVDDDVALPPRFIDRFLAVCERLSLDLAQPAQSRRSHAAWRVTRRRALSLVRRTAYVEIGPVTALSRRVAADLVPFPALRFGWGLDSHWGALARERGWALGVVDALPVRHERQSVASAYTHADAIAEAKEFLRDRPYLPAADAQRTLATVRRLGA